MEVNYTPIGVIFEISITARERKALWEIFAHIIGVHIEFTIVVHPKFLTSRLIWLCYKLAYYAYWTTISLRNRTWMILTALLRIGRDIEFFLAVNTKCVAWY